MHDSTVIWPKDTAGGSAGRTDGGSEKASSGPKADSPTEAGAELETWRSRLDQLSKRLAEQCKYVSGVAFPAE